MPEVTAQNADLTEPGLLYSKMLQDYIDGKRDPAFLKRMAMMAAQAGDKPGALLAGRDYIASLKMPLSEEDIKSVNQFTRSTKDAGFKLTIDNLEQFKKVLGDRPVTVSLMNMIFKGDIEPMLQSTDKPDWNAIGSIAKKYGAPGEEIFLRARTIDHYNKQEWANYVPVAKEYLEKYGKNISNQDKAAFQGAIDQHK
jgi:hypothetical protein